MWESLNLAVTEAIERKRRLGQYWVQWTATGPQIQQPNAVQDALRTDNQR
jgi:hypothetical protein